MKLIQVILLAAALDAFAAAQAPDASAGGAKPDPILIYRTMDNPGVPGSLDIIFGKDKDAGYVARLRAVHALSDNLSAPEVQALIYFLHRRVSEDSLQPLEFNAVKNDIVNRLMAQKAKPVDLNMHLVAMYHDQESDYVWRDYCIQFLAPGYANAWSDEEKALIIDTLWKASKESGKGVAGTALISLSALAASGAVSKEDVSGRAYELLVDARNANVARSTALQVCANLGNRKALTAAREIIASEKDVPLKMSAIAAVGVLGGRDDIALLRPLAESPDNRLRTAAGAALKKLDSSVSSGGTAVKNGK